MDPAEKMFDKILGQAQHHFRSEELDSVGLSYGDLELLKSECKDREEFVRILKDRGINSKPLQEKLSKHFKYSQRK